MSMLTDMSDYSKKINDNFAKVKNAVESLDIKIQKLEGDDENIKLIKAESHTLQNIVQSPIGEGLPGATAGSTVP